MSYWNKAASTIRGPVGNPAVVRPAHRLRVINIIGVSLPREVEAGIDNRRIEPFFVESCETVLRIAGPKWDFVAVFGPPIEIASIASHLTHLGDGTESSPATHTRRCAINFKIFESVVVFLQTDSIGSILRLAVLLPARGRFQNVAVGVNRTRILELMDFFSSLRYVSCLDSM